MNHNLQKRLSLYWDKFGTLVILILLVCFMAIFGPPQFIAPGNLLQIAIQSSITIIIACGEFFAILIAGIDLSVGSVMGLVGMVTAKLIVLDIMPWYVAVLLGILSGALCGLFNGLLINVTGLHPFVITLGTQSIFRGVTLIISDATSVYGFPQTFKDAMGGWLGGVIPSAVVIALLLAAILWFFSSKTVMGRNIFALGGNKEAAWFSGIHTKLYTLLVHTLCGVCFGLAGIVYTARIGSAEPLAGQGYETFAIASAIIGGTSFFGGRGKIPTVVVGGLIIGTISNGLNMLGVSSYYQQIVTGALIIVAVTVDRLFKGKSAK
ncbi:D-allose ABC transporter permease [Zongyangia hominis]|uniref:D-allose ABC transporter permease n=1 Tax=Zongyangia hominis TaxID=2763677 RepID=A0A926EEQ3_9FIRM|nr:D-allose ABC transporter permease [Zongyangia hominis]MBC8570711.1 D-allose ABC transporter permease [Zongyangia hominis]